MYEKWFGSMIWGVVDVSIFISISYFRKNKSKYAITDNLFLLSMIYIFIRSFYTSQELGISIDIRIIIQGLKQITFHLAIL